MKHLKLSIPCLVIYSILSTVLLPLAWASSSYEDMSRNNPLYNKTEEVWEKVKRHRPKLSSTMYSLSSTQSSLRRQGSDLDYRFYQMKSKSKRIAEKFSSLDRQWKYQKQLLNNLKPEKDSLDRERKWLQQELAWLNSNSSSLIAERRLLDIQSSNLKASGHRLDSNLASLNREKAGHRCSKYCQSWHSSYNSRVGSHNSVVKQHNQELAGYKSRRSSWISRRDAWKKRSDYRESRRKSFNQKIKNYNFHRDQIINQMKDNKRKWKAANEEIKTFHKEYAKFNEDQRSYIAKVRAWENSARVLLTELAKTTTRVTIPEPVAIAKRRNPENNFPGNRPHTPSTTPIKRPPVLKTPSALPRVNWDGGRNSKGSPSVLSGNKKDPDLGTIQEGKTPGRTGAYTLTPKLEEGIVNLRKNLFDPKTQAQAKQLNHSATAAMRDFEKKSPVVKLGKWNSSNRLEKRKEPPLPDLSPRFISEKNKAHQNWEGEKNRALTWIKEQAKKLKEEVREKFLSDAKEMLDDTMNNTRYGGVYKVGDTWRKILERFNVEIKEGTLFEVARYNANPYATDSEGKRLEKKIFKLQTDIRDIVEDE